MSDKTTEHPGTVFKRAMDKTVLSRKQVAEELKVGEATLRMFLSGKDPMSLKMAKKVAVFFEKYDCFSEDYKRPEYWSSLDKISNKMQLINDEKDFEIEVLAEDGEISGIDIVTINEKSFDFERIKT